MGETQKVTPWFPAKVRPVHIGVYEVDQPYGKPKRAFRKWDGRSWYAWAWTIHGAENCGWRVHRNDYLPWRGLASKP